MEAAAGGAIGGVIGLLLVAVVGLVIGAVAKLLMPGPDRGGWLATILLGVADSWVGSFVFGRIVSLRTTSETSATSCTRWSRCCPTATRSFNRMI